MSAAKRGGGGKAVGRKPGKHRHVAARARSVPVPTKTRPQPAAEKNGRRPNAAKRARRLAAKKADAMPVVAPLGGPRQVRIVDADMVEPFPKGGLLEVLQQPYLLRLLVSRMLASMYAASLLGLLWSYIQPAIRFATYYIVFGFVLKLHRGFPDFALHLFVGIVFVHYFSETWNGGTRSIWQNKSLVQKNRIPREMFPVAAMVVAAYHTFPQLLLLILICLIVGWHISLSGLAAFALGLAILVLFATAMALFFSAINVFFKDFQNVVATMLQFLHFMVPMMYPFSRIWNVAGDHPVLYQLYMANPVAEGVILMQKFFWWGVVDPSNRHGDMLVYQGQRVREFPPDLWVRGIIMVVVCGLLLVAAQRFFKRVEGKFAERM